MQIKEKWEKETQKLVDAMSLASANDVVTYDQMSAIIDARVTSHTVPLRRALLRLEKVGLVFVNIPAVGYQRAGNTQIAVSVVPNSRKKTYRAGKRAVRKAAAVVVGQLPRTLKPTFWAEQRSLSSVVHNLHGNAVRKNGNREKKSNIFRDTLSKMSERYHTSEAVGSKAESPE